MCVVQKSGFEAQCIVGVQEDSTSYRGVLTYEVVEQTGICSSRLTRVSREVFIIPCTQDNEGCHRGYLATAKIMGIRNYKTSSYLIILLWMTLEVNVQQLCIK